MGEKSEGKTYHRANSICEHEDDAFEERKTRDAECRGITLASGCVASQVYAHDSVNFMIDGRGNGGSYNEYVLVPRKNLGDLDETFRLSRG